MRWVLFQLQLCLGWCVFLVSGGSLLVWVIQSLFSIYIRNISPRLLFSFIASVVFLIQKKQSPIYLQRFNNYYFTTSEETKIYFGFIFHPHFQFYIILRKLYIILPSLKHDCYFIHFMFELLYSWLNVYYYFFLLFFLIYWVWEEKNWIHSNILNR